MSRAASLFALALVFLAGIARGGDLHVLGELTPSAGLPSGARIEALGFEAKARFTRGAAQALPPERLAALFGLEGRIRWSQRTGGYRQSISPNLVATIEGGGREGARVAAFAMAWMYVYQQDAVPFFAAAPAGRPAVRFVFERELTPVRENAMFAALVDSLGEEAGYTRVGERDIVVIDFAGDPAFADRLARFATEMAAMNPVLRAEPFLARSDYPCHDWRAEPDGASLLAGIRRAFASPGIEAALRGMRARYARFVAGWLARMSLEEHPEGLALAGAHLP